MTSNHTHLLVTSGERGTPQIPEALQFVHGETAQHYNLARRCEGSFWSNRFHATRVQTGRHLGRCLLYIDLNMVRAGAVDHPSEWTYGTWPEFVGDRKRYRIVDQPTLLRRLEIESWPSFTRRYRTTMDGMLRDRDALSQQSFWSSAIAVGERDWLERTARGAGMRRYETRDVYDAGCEDMGFKTCFLGSIKQSKAT